MHFKPDLMRLRTLINIKGLLEGKVMERKLAFNKIHNIYLSIYCIR